MHAAAVAGRADVRRTALAGRRPRRRRRPPVPGHLPRPGRRPPDDGVHRHPLQRRLLRALPRSYLAERGYGFLGWNTRFRGAEAYFLLDHALAEIAVGVRWLREQGVERIVLLGNSGGGSLMGAYHSQSVEPNIRPARDRTVLPAALDLPPCDLFVFVAAHPGRPEVLTDWMDASVVDETRSAVARPVARPVRPGPAVRRRVRRPLPRRPARRATPASPPGATPSSTAWPPPGTSAATGCSR